MTAVPKKKQRYEGLIQFQDPLRTTLVCLQAALAERFTTGAQLEFLKAKDTPEASHFLLTSDGSKVGEMNQGLESRHLLMRIEQIEKNLPTWTHTVGEPKIAAWLDSSDTLTSQYVYQLLAHAVAKVNQFDLKQVYAWGAATASWHDAQLMESETWQNNERKELQKAFKSEAASLFKQIDKQSLSTDGCSVALLLEGSTQLCWNDLATASLQRLAQANRHLIAVNYISGDVPQLQIAFTTPMRLPLKNLNASALKGFMLMKDIKETAKVTKSMLAS